MIMPTTTSTISTLELALSVLRDCSDEAGDVPMWNKGGDGYAAVKAIKKELAKLQK